jgi:multidrug efflux system outer membrane protein
MRSLSLLVAALVLAGCTSLAPDYQRPTAPVAGAWHTATATATTTTTTATTATATATSSSAAPVADTTWQQFFTEPRLRDLISQALVHNRDLRIAALNIERARALYGIERAGQWPTVTAGATSSLQRTPADLSPSGRAETSRRHDLAVGISSYELDFFGRVKSLNDAALQQFLATEEARRSVHMSLVAEVANGYLALAADRERLQLARDTLQNQRDALALVRARVDGGVASPIDLRRAQTTVEAARADLARFTAQVAQDENALALLVGAPLSAAALPASLEPVSTLDALPEGVPSQVLQRRPDIRAAEHRLQAANAHIGAARAAFFPSVTLTAGGGLASRGLSDLFQGGAGAWTFMPQIVLPIFDGGRRRAALGAAQAERDIALAEYEAAIQRAFREVADALALRGTLGDQLDAQQSLVAATEDTFRLSDVRFRQGAQGYLEVLDAQRGMYAARQALIGTRLTRLSNQVTLYKALGGGWS